MQKIRIIFIINKLIRPGPSGFSVRSTAKHYFSHACKQDANFGWRPVYKHEKNNAWLYFVPKNRRVMVAGSASPEGGEWYIGSREIGQTYGWLKAKDTTNGIPTQNWYKPRSRRRIPVRITKRDKNGNRI